VSKVITSVRSAVCSLDTGPRLFLNLFIALSIIGLRCSKSAQKFAFRVCHVATVVMETT